MLVNHLLELKEHGLAAERIAEHFLPQPGLNIAAWASSDGGSGPTVVDQPLAELNRQLVAAAAAQANARANLQQTRILITAGHVDRTTDVLASPVIQHLCELEADLISRAVDVSSRLIPGSAMLTALRAQIEVVHNEINQEISKISPSLTSEVAAAQGREASPRMGLDKLLTQVSNQGIQAVRLQQLGQDADAAKIIYQEFLEQDKCTASSADMQLRDAELIAIAKVPLALTYPRYGLIIAGSFVVPCILAVLLAIWLERNHVGFWSTDELELETGLPVLELLPAISQRARWKFNSSRQPPGCHEEIRAICARIWSQDSITQADA